MRTHVPEDDLNNLDPRERQLGEQLSKILRKPPKCRKHTLAHAEKIHSEKPKTEIEFVEAPPAIEIDYDEPLQSIATKPESTNLDSILPADPVRPEETSRLRETTVVKTTRRARFRHGAQQISSWIITIAVTAFISVCVAIILLGIPQTIELATGTTSMATGAADGPTPKTVKVNTVRVKAAPPAP